MIALVLLIVFGAVRYDHFLGAYNVLSVLRYNSMFALTSLGMCSVIMGPAWISRVGTTAAFASVVSALLSPIAWFPGSLGGLRRRPRRRPYQRLHGHADEILPFIATLSGMLAASGSGLLLARNQSVSVTTTPISLGWDKAIFGLPVPRGSQRSLTSMARSCSITRASALRARGRRQRGSSPPHGSAGRPRDVRTYVQSGVSRPRRRDPRRAIRGRSARGRRRLGTVLDRRCRGRRHATDRRRRVRGDHARRRPPARPNLQVLNFQTASAGSASPPIGNRWCAASF